MEMTHEAAEAAEVEERGEGNAEAEAGMDNSGFDREDSPPVPQIGIKSGE